MNSRVYPWSWRLLNLVCLLALVATVPAGEALPTDGLRPLPALNLEGLGDEVRADLLSARSDLDALRQTVDISRESLGEAFGELARLYHAHDVYPPAEIAYLNAEHLRPDDFRWPYYRANLYLKQDAMEKAAAAFERARALNPDYGPAGLRLGLAYLALDRPGSARPLLEAAARDDSLRAAALAGLGNLAFSQRNFADAVADYSQALEADPAATRLHYPLAMAYRALGDLEAARRHLGMRSQAEAEIPDPLMAELGELLSGAKTHYYYAMAAVHSRRFDLAAKSFAKGLARDPDNLDARVSLARSLYLSGDRDAAEEQLHEVLQRDPGHALGQFLTGVMEEGRGNLEAAKAHYRAALKADPAFGGAHHYLGSVLMREGQFAEAATHLRQAGAEDAKNLPAQLMATLAAYRAGEPRSTLRARAEALLEAHPDDAHVQSVAARLLACGGEEDKEGGQRALELAKPMFEAAPLADNAEVLAMSYAALGRYQDAGALQEATREAVMLASRFDMLERIDANMERYRRKQTCNEPWHPSDPLFYPMSDTGTRLFRDYPAKSPY